MSVADHLRVMRQPVVIAAGEARLSAELEVPSRVRGVVVFASGSGSSPHTPGNRSVVDELHRGGFATLLLDLLTLPEEQADLERGTFRFDVDLLAHRLVRAADWLAHHDETRGLPIGYFAGSTGVAASLLAAVHRPRLVSAIVSHSGRPDLADGVLPAVRVPTLLIVAESDSDLLELNRQALALLRCEKELSVIRGATHLFDAPGALADVANLAREWFHKHLVPKPASAGNGAYP